MTEHILSLSYGKDSMACLGALEDEELIPEKRSFRWSALDETQLTADWYITHGGEHHDQRRQNPQHDG